MVVPLLLELDDERVLAMVHSNLFEVKDVLSVFISVSSVHIGDLDAWQAARHLRTDPLL